MCLSHCAPFKNVADQDRCSFMVAQAAKQMAKKPKSDAMLGDSDGECCESESCQKWPEIFKEAKAGCNQTSIHDDCPAPTCSLQRHCKGRYVRSESESVQHLPATTLLITSQYFVHRGNAMFEVSDEDGSRNISRCGYSLVSGQVYKCGSVGSPVQCSPDY